MRRVFLLILLLAGMLTCFAGYGLALLDWVHDCQNGVYRQHWGEACLETLALLLYTFLGIRFALSRINLLL